MRSVFLLLTCLLTAAADGATAEVTIVVSGPDGAAARVGAPLSLEVDLGMLLGEKLGIGRWLHLSEVIAGTGSPPVVVPVQFEPEAPNSQRGKIWWLMPPGPEVRRKFRLVVIPSEEVAPACNVNIDRQGKLAEVTESGSPVLRYNHGTVPVPEGTEARYARGDYISPLYGPGGEALTDDYPRDHPHHRGVSWSWPVTRLNDEVRDIWAVLGVWARPVAMHRVSTGPVLAVLRADSLWKWGDTKPIVHEQVVIRAFHSGSLGRFVDVDVTLTAMVSGVAIGGRPKRGYGGFAFRAAPAKERTIATHGDPVGADPRRAWIDYSGVFADGKGRVGVTIFEHRTNPDYPSDLHQYPSCNCVMPAFPGAREVHLLKGKPLLLRHRLWIHPGAAEEKTAADVWSAYCTPPKVTLAD